MSNLELGFVVFAAFWVGSFVFLVATIRGKRQRR